MRWTGQKTKTKIQIVDFLITAEYWQFDAISGQLPEPLDPLPVPDDLPMQGVISQPKNGTRGKHFN